MSFDGVVRYERTSCTMNGRYGRISSNMSGSRASGNVVCYEGISWSWTGSAGRAVVAGWCILGLMLTSCYTSKLTSLLVGVIPSPPFTSVAEMLAQDEYRWGTIGGSKLVQILRVSDVLDHNRMKGKKKERKRKKERNF